uniref:Uncharacterized protein n=1 Tax=Picea glauca TaxID=3330 RepID=A0A117NGJ4_PICGL|nr:hypothetical protein ABT39_MTgene6335 [Picea glauca]QHR87031.1 hypothetical protein Q903MT_gene1040 [Picea sitchensis]
MFLRTTPSFKGKAFTSLSQEKAPACREGVQLILLSIIQPTQQPQEGGKEQYPIPPLLIRCHLHLANIGDFIIPFSFPRKGPGPSRESWESDERSKSTTGWNGLLLIFPGISLFWKAY